jgi:hypothetical protein
MARLNAQTFPSANASPSLGLKTPIIIHTRYLRVKEVPVYGSGVGFKGYLL